MQKQFVTYEIATMLKELGFDEPCLYAFCEEGGWNKYKRERERITYILKTDGSPFGTFFAGKNWNKEIIVNTKSKIQCSAPLWQQVIDWLREKHHLVLIVETAYYPTAGKYDAAKYCYKILGIFLKSSSTIFRTVENKSPVNYEQAREAAILEALKLIK